jgi:hypothetical protein
MNNKKALAKAIEHHNRNFVIYLRISENAHLIPDNILKTLLAITRFMPNAYPSIDTISKMTGRSTRSTMRDISQLEELGLIKVTRSHRKPSVYNIGFLGDKALSCKDDSRVTNGASLGDKALSFLGDKALSPHHIKDHINKHIKGFDFNLTDEERQERQKLVEEYRSKANKISSV